MTSCSFDRLLGLALVTSLAACAVDAPAPDAAALDARRRLIRASLDVRGIRPSLEELDQVKSDPDAVDGLVEGFVDHPGFARRVRAIFAPALRTRRDEISIEGEAFGLDAEDEGRFAEAVTEEALNLIADVAVADRPFTEILTADYTVIDEILVAGWPVVPAEPASTNDGLVRAHYVDGRPAAGVLATNAFFWRHRSTLENANRGRANAISRAFLCEDYLERPIDFPSDIDLSDADAIENAIDHNAACQACHATLDPLASHLWGFMVLTEDASAVSRYHPENERMWQPQTGAAPAFYGRPTDGSLATLATAIANDPRFVSCVVRRSYEALLGRPAALEDEGQLAAHREVFLDSGLSFKRLVQSLLHDPAYRGLAEASAFGGTPAPVADKLVSPELLQTSLEALTGYRMTIDGRDVTRVDAALRAFAGGSESGPTATPSLGQHLTQRRLAEGAADHLVTGAGADSVLGQLLAALPRETPPDPDALTPLLRVAQGDPPDLARRRDAATQLWRDVADSDGPAAAWAALLTALLADPDLAIY